MSADSRNRSMMKQGLLASAAAFGIAFALVPLYRVACEKLFGIKLEESAVDVSKLKVDLDREVTIEFDTSVNSKLPWSFSADTRTIKVHPGQLTEAIFHARNNSDLPIVGQAVPSLAPSEAAIYFNKTECFCFTQQVLAAGEERAMPVRFVVDPKLPDKVETLTLSYTFFNNEIATQQLLSQGDAAVGAP